MDGQVVRHQPPLSDLLEKFVCVRRVQANGIDLSLFQFDYDLTWAVMFLNADRTIYGRYGTRTSRELTKEISIESFKKAMEGALELHRNYPSNKASLAGKTGPNPQVKVPEAYPMLRKVGYTATVNPRNPGGGNPGACIHCHQINNNVYRSYRGLSLPIPESVLWAYPVPTVLGLELEVNERATVQAVVPASPAAKDGFKDGDEILTLGGQPILSIADVQWVLHQSKREPDQLKAEVKRSGALTSLTLNLAKDWRKAGDFSWRACNGIISPLPEASHDLTADEKKKLGLSPSAIAIRVLWDGRGFQKNDLVVEVDGQRNGMTTSDFIAYTVQRKKPKEKIALIVSRAGQEHRIEVEAKEAPIE